MKKLISIIALIVISNSYATNIKDGVYSCVASDGPGTLVFTFHEGTLTVSFGKMNTNPVRYYEVQRTNYTVLKVKPPLKEWSIFPAKFTVENQELIEVQQPGQGSLLCAAK